MRMLCIWLAIFTAGVAKAADEKTPQSVSIETAAQHVTEAVRRSKPKAAIEGLLPVKDLTTDVIWDKLHVQVVQVQGGNIAPRETFVLRGENVWPIARSFGGTGVASLAVADLAGDKRPLLIYVFNWGSGVQRWEIGVADLHDKSAKETFVKLTNHSDKDFKLRAIDNGGVEVLAGDTVVGEATAQRRGKELTAAIKLREKLPDELRRELR